MEFKEVVIADASTEAKVAALALLIDKRLSDLANIVLTTKKLQGPKGEQGIQGPKGEQGERGLDGQAGKDGKDGVDGKDGAKGKDGVGVSNAYVDFDGSLVIELTDGRQINAGEVVTEGAADKIRLVKSGGGNSQPVLDDIAALQAALAAINSTIATYGTMATQNANNVAITGGAIDGTTVGETTPAAGTFTTLTATGQTSLGGVAGSEGLRVLKTTSSVNWIQAAGGSTTTPVLLSAQGSDTDIGFRVSSFGAAAVRVFTNNAAQEQFRVSHTASAVNYVQVTGAATGGTPTISAQGSDAAVNLLLLSKGTGSTVISRSSSGTYFQNGSSQNQFIVGNTTSAVNYLTAAGSITGNGIQLSATGTDTNISQVFQSKGTGAIDLAAGSRGVNISNGGTVTAITRTAPGTGYTSIPSVAVTAPTTAGGVQATLQVATMETSVGATIASGGTGYTVGDVLSVVGGTSTTTATYTVSTVSAGVITGLNATSRGSYTVLPSSPVSLSGGTGSGATLNLTWAVTSFTITNAGSGYVEQPTVTFSGGGGSGAAAYATVGSGTVVKSIGSTFDIATPTFITSSIPVARFRDVGGADTFTQFQPNIGYTQVIAQGNSNGNLFLAANGTGRVSVQTNGTSQTEQLRVSHTASAVNYVQVTGGATTGQVSLTAQGSDTNVTFGISAKGANTVSFYTNNNGSRQAAVLHTAGTIANYATLTGNVTGSAPVFGVAGSDTNIDLTLTPKGTGLVRFGTYTAGAPAATGYISIKAADGTTYKVLVGT